jgi:chemotaxis protein methyltransferase CheR
VGARGIDDLLCRADAGDPAARGAARRVLLVAETYLLRHPEQFELVRAEIASRPGPVRLWSAGCATGEEAWSLAIVARELLGPEADGRVEILATDVNDQALAHAARGVYRPWSLRRLPDRLRTRWFHEDAGLWRVDDRLRPLVRFAPLDLLSGTGAGWPDHVDVALCRNVLLYLLPDAALQVVRHIAASLAPDGVLLLAPTDPVPPTAALVPIPLVLGTGLRRAGVVVEPPMSAIAAGPASFPPAAARIASPPDASRMGIEAALARGHVQEALALLDLALSQDPHRTDLRVLRATVRQSLGDDRGVLGDARLALAAELLFLCDALIDSGHRGVR